VLAEAVVLAGAFFLFPVAFGVLLRALIVRGCATLSALPEGFTAMPSNIHRLWLCTSPLHTPELLPGLQESDFLRLKWFGVVTYALARSNELPARLLSPFFALMAVIMFFPGWAYRFLMKSTLWFWWILYVIGGSPAIKGGVSGLKADMTKQWTKLSRFFALLSIVLVLALTIPAIQNWLSSTDNPHVLPLIAFGKAVFDVLTFKALPILNLLASVLVLAIWFWADAIVKDSHVPDRDVSSSLSRLSFAINCKTAISIAIYLLIALYILMMINAQRHWLPVTPYFAGWLEALYGDYAKALLPAAK
jgi:hypothetical protein